MKRSNLLQILFMAGMLLTIGFFVFANSQASDVPMSTPSLRNTQQVTLSERDLNYYPSTIRVKEGQPVSITLDDSVKGCLRAFTIKELGVEKYARTTTDTIEFTPKYRGTYHFSCTMGMGYGTLIVEQT